MTNEASIAKARVKAGAKFLKEKRPVWYNEIDLDKLDISHSNYCVGGQLGGIDYSETMSEWNLTRIEAQKLGFDSGYADGTLYISCPALTEAWQERILKLRAKSTQALDDNHALLDTVLNGPMRNTALTMLKAFAAKPGV